MVRTSSRGGLGPPSSVREKRIDLQFANPTEFKRALLEVEPAGLFAPGRYDVQVGDSVTVYCVFPGVPDGVALRTRVLWRRLAGGRDPSVLAGLGLVLRSPSMATFRRLVEYSEGRAELPGRKEERFETKIPVRCEFGEKDVVRVPGHMVDVSIQGAALRIQHRAAVGDRLRLKFKDPKERESDLEAFVTWVRNAGTGPDSMALVGVEVQCPRRADLESWERLVARARAETRIATEYRSD